MERAVIIDRQGDIAIVTLNAPQTRNALSETVVVELLDFLESANADSALRCIVLTGAGKAFCSGGDLREMQAGGHPMFAGAPHAMQAAYRTHIQRIPLAFHALDVPVIAAVNGAAVGAGCDIACMADIRIAADTARFAESFLRVGLISGDGGAWFLPQVIGPARAMEMALTCAEIDAETAQAWGMVSRVVPGEALLETAMELAARIAAFPPVSARLNKRLIRQSLKLDLPASLELAAAFQAIVQKTDDHKEAVNALLDRRAPNYLGR